jgi:hypothetical protein
MANARFYFIHLSKVNHPRNAMSLYHLASKLKLTIAIWVTAWNPIPTISKFWIVRVNGATLINLLPKVSQLARREVDRVWNFRDGIGSVCNRVHIMILSLAVSGASYIRDGVFIFAFPHAENK